MSSMFLAQKYNLHFDDEHYKNHEAYLQSWAQVLENDPNELYRAASQAEKAVSYIKEEMLEKGLEKLQDKLPVQSLAVKNEIEDKEKAVSYKKANSQKMNKSRQYIKEKKAGLAL